MRVSLALNKESKITGQVSVHFIFGRQNMVPDYMGIIYISPRFGTGREFLRGERESLIRTPEGGRAAGCYAYISHSLPFTCN